MVERALRMEGTCTGEHGVGTGKKVFLEQEVGAEAIQLMRDLKLTMDPKWIMNPGALPSSDVHPSFHFPVSDAQSDTSALRLSICRQGI